MNDRIKKLPANIIIYTILSIIALTTIYPLLYTLTMSLSSSAEAAKIGFHLFPKEFNFASYKMVLQDKEIHMGYFNTITRTVAGTLISVLITAMFAYPLSKSNMPNKKLYTFLLLFTMLFDGGMIPNYLLIKNLNLIDNRLVYILPTIINAYNIIIMKSFFTSIPDSLAESAKLDGANEITILFRIILPLSKSVLATVALWVAVSHWNGWLDGMLYINSNSKQILQILLQRIITFNQSSLMENGAVGADIMSYNTETIKSATIIITILPILAVYPFVQKYFTTGVMLGSVKG